MLLGSLKIEETITDQSSSISMRNKTKAEASKAALQASGRFNAPIVTSIEPAQPFIWQKKSIKNTTKAS